jgi:hypothetical protein
MLEYRLKEMSQRSSNSLAQAPPTKWKSLGEGIRDMKHIIAVLLQNTLIVSGRERGIKSLF